MRLNCNPFTVIIQFPYWPKDWWGFTFAPFIFVKDISDINMVKHELIHVKQQYKHFIIWFWIRYIYQLITKGYKNIDYEIEAYKVTKIGETSWL